LIGNAIGTDLIDRSKASQVQGQTSTGIDKGTTSTSTDIKGQSSQQAASPQGNYNCQLRIYVNEPVSRWKDITGFYEYDFGFIGFAENKILSIPYLGTYTDTIIWSVPAFIGTVDGNNIAVTAAVFNLDDGHTAYSDPPAGAPFTAYYVDATAYATPGNPGADHSGGGFTHTVFIEEATATW
jgi:hypothetical protein